jgi:hypothetical protein
MKTRRKLNLEYWGRIHDMCDAHNAKCGVKKINQQDCVKINMNVFSSKCCDPCAHPNFVSNPENYELAVGIVDDTPVFANDTAYEKVSGYKHIIRDGCIPPDISATLTLTPPKPKREFELNGKMLPCPDEDYDESVLELLGEHYYFDSVEDRNKVAREIRDLLDNARDKE